MYELRIDGVCFLHLPVKTAVIRGMHAMGDRVASQRVESCTGCESCRYRKYCSRTTFTGTLIPRVAADVPVESESRIQASTRMTEAMTWDPFAPSAAVPKSTPVESTPVELPEVGRVAGSHHGPQAGVRRRVRVVVPAAVVPAVTPTGGRLSGSPHGRPHVPLGKFPRVRMIGPAGDLPAEFITQVAADTARACSTFGGVASDLTTGVTANGQVPDSVRGPHSAGLTNMIGGLLAGGGPLIHIPVSAASLSAPTFLSDMMSSIAGIIDMIDLD